MEDFENLYKQYYDQVYFYLLGICRDDDLAEEVTQETFFKVLSKLDSFKGDCKISVWIMQIAKYSLYNHFRRKKTVPEAALENIAADCDIEENFADRDCAERIGLLLRDLKEPYKTVFRLRTFGGLSFREIGLRFGKTESWARVTYYRAKVMIKEELQ